MSKRYDCILIVVEDECVNEAIQRGIELAIAGYVNVYHYRSGILVATKEEIPEEYDHTQFPLVSDDASVLNTIVELGLYREGYPSEYKEFNVLETCGISK